MLQVMIVDDEPYVRQMIRGMVNWEQLGLSVSAECFNGREALRLLQSGQQADILITDLKMPVMGGIELIESAFRLEINLYIIVISAYDDFQLVRSAFQLGARDYLLKSEMTKEQLTHTLTKASTSILPHTARNAVLQPAMGNIPARALLSSMINGNCRAEEIELFVRQLRLPAGTRTAVAGVRQSEPVQDELADRICSFYASDASCRLQQPFFRCEWAGTSDRLLFFFTAYSSAESLASIMQHLTGIRRLLTGECHFDVGISHVAEGCQLLPRLIEEARVALNSVFLQGHDSIIHYNYLQSRTVPPGFDSAKQLAVLEELLFSVQSFPPNGSEVLCLHPEQLSNCHIAEVRELYMRYYFLLRDYAAQHPQKTKLPEILDRYEQNLRENGTLQELNSWLREALRAARGQGQEFSIVNKIKFFIRQHYGENLSLNSIAQEFYLSASYLSRLFSEKEGISLIDYISHIRVQEAILLMERTNLKIYEITERVGYANPEHFSRVFKKITGMSPKKFMAGKAEGTNKKISFRKREERRL